LISYNLLLVDYSLISYIVYYTTKKSCINLGTIIVAPIFLDGILIL